MPIIHFRYPFILCLLIFVISSCKKKQYIRIITIDKAFSIEKSTANDLKEDLEKVVDLQVVMENTFSNDENIIQFILTTARDLSYFDQLDDIDLTTENPGSRGGLWKKIGKNTILLAGSDHQGLQYAVYDYCEEILGIDPLSYWTGYQSESINPKQLFEFTDRIIEPPLVPLMGYFENDADELMNLKKPLLSYDWESFTEMIDALVRMRYNVFHFFDALGRPEFYRRPEYQELAPDYKIDLAYVDKMIDYVQDKGILVQIDLALGYQAKSLESEYADCWSKHKDKWKEVWHYYLTETPFGKADIFSLRPRNQVWDWEYKSNCGEDKISVFNEVYREFGEIIDRHNPEALKVVVCYADAMNMFNKDFRPPKDWIVAWSDDGYGEFKVLPDNKDNYRMGTYMHAGFWKNHTVNHPYVHTIDSIMHKMFSEYQATNYCLVNGQQFRPFILNLEAFSRVCQDPENFTAQEFYEDWAARYFPKDLRPSIIELMIQWDEASFGKAGYVQNLWEIKEVLAYLAEKDITRPGKPPTKSTRLRVENDVDDAQKRLILMSENLDMAREILANIKDNDAYFYDQIYHPLLLYCDLLKFEVTLHELYDLKIKMEDQPDQDFRQQAQEKLNRARSELTTIYQHSLKDSKIDRWNGWYDPAVRRPNNGFPTFEMLDKIALTLQ